MLLTLLLATANCTLLAQISQGGTPTSWGNDKINWRMGVEELPAFDVDAMLEEDEINHAAKDSPYRFGKNFVMGHNLGNSGDWTMLPNGDAVWMMKYISTGAYSLNISFDRFELSEGAKLFVYSEDHQHLLGAFTSYNNNPEGMGTYPIPGEAILLELHIPADETGQSFLQIETVTHAYRDLDVVARGIGDSGACNNNVVCPEGAPWQDQINSVAMIVVNGNGICTGALINNTANDGYPYFLSANHCLGGSVASWVYRFNWQSTTCAGNNVGSFDTVSGSNLLSSGAGTDYALLEINNGAPVPTAYNPYYAGWDATGVFPTSQVAIHHPSGDLKKISFDNQAAGQANFGGAQCWQIFTWEDGTTEPGSSGSPLFDQNQRIIGQLYGGQASCANNINDYYGRFDLTYPNICNWIAPGCNTLVLDGYDPNTPTVGNDAQLLSISSPVGPYCAASVTPEIVVRNAGSLTLTSFTINYSVDGGANQTESWSGTLASGSTTTISLPAITPGDGAHTFDVSLSNPNGVADENPANDSGNSNFSTDANGVTIDFTLTTDNYPGETTWDIRDTGGTVLFADGPYAGQQTTYTYSFCLPAGCYQLNVYDSFGDGMQYQGVVGDYTLTDEGGTVLAQMVAGGNFGSQATHDFCLTAQGVDGCTDPTACNYDPAATNDDGSCEFLSCAGCTNAQACNYNPAATIDDGSCQLPDGCTDPGACNYNAGALCDDGSCEFLSCAGCTNAQACNYDPAAIIDDGSCQLPDGCTDPGACNYNAGALCDDGTCDFGSTYYVDGDGDGFGAGAGVLLCAPQAGYSTNDLDCDDGNGNVYPDAPPTQEGIDNDCNGTVDPDEAAPCMGDFNSDGERNVADLLTLLTDFGCTGSCIGDMNQDQVVNGADFLDFLSVFGIDCSQ